MLLKGTLLTGTNLIMPTTDANTNADAFHLLAAFKCHDESCQAAIIITVMCLQHFPLYHHYISYDDNNTLCLLSVTGGILKDIFHCGCYYMRDAHTHTQWLIKHRWEGSNKENKQGKILTGQLVRYSQTLRFDVTLFWRNLTRTRQSQFREELILCLGLIWYVSFPGNDITCKYSWSLMIQRCQKWTSVMPLTGY